MDDEEKVNPSQRGGRRSRGPKPARSGGRALVIPDPTLMVRLDNERIVVSRKGEQVAAVPIADLSHMALHGPITMSGAAVARLLDAGVEVALHSTRGRYRGVITSAQPKNVFLLLAQVDAWNRPERRLAFARPLVMAKIAGQRQLVQRHALDHGAAICAEATQRLGALEERAQTEEDLDALRGIEGAASAAYFEAFAGMVGEGWTFPKRVRRPPTDPVNALLSYGYVIATSEVARHLTAGGLDTRIGLFHGIQYGRESLPLDLVEELRAPMVDRFTLSILHRRQVQAGDFESEASGAVRLTLDGRRRYLTLWEEMLSRRAPGLLNEAEEAGMESAERVGGAPASSQAEVTWRQRIERQVFRLKRFLLQGVPYRPMMATKKGAAPTDEGEGEGEGVDSQRGEEEGDVRERLDEDGDL